MKIRIIPRRQIMVSQNSENVKVAVVFVLLLFQIFDGIGQTLKSASGIKGLNDGLVAYYPFDGNANDASGNSKNGMIIGTPEFLTGISGKGIRLEGATQDFGVTDKGDHIILPVFDFSHTKQFTLSVWVKEESLTYWHGTGYVFLGDGFSGNASIGHWGDYNNSSSFMGFAAGATNASSTNDPNHPEFFLIQPFDGLNKWVHYASTFKDDTLKAYINGKFAGKKYQKMKISGNNAGLACHWWDSGKEISTRFTGMMDEVRIYNRALDGQEINSLFTYFPGTASKSVKVITLAVKQAPELVYIVSNTEITINQGNSVVLGNNLTISGGSGNYSYRWLPGKALSDSTILHPVANPSDTTNYLLTVTDINGCSFSVGYKVNVKKQTVGAELLQAGKTLEALLFPNPNQGKFNIRLTGEPAELIELTLFSITGEMVKRQIISDFQGNLTETMEVKLAPGVYTIIIKAGNEILSREFIVN